MPNAPEAAVEPTGAATPATPEQPAAAASDQAPDQRPAPPSETEPITPAQFTQRSQEVAAIRRELGLPPKASGDDILKAIGDLRRKAQGVVMDDEIVDPKVATRIAEADERLWKSLGYVHGDIASKAREYADYARTSRDPEELVEKFYELMPRDASRPPAMTPGEPTEPAVPTPPAAMGLADSDTRPSGASNEAAASEEFRNTGNVAGFLKRLGRFSPAQE